MNLRLGPAFSLVWLSVASAAGAPAHVFSAAPEALPAELRRPLAVPSTAAWIGSERSVEISWTSRETADVTGYRLTAAYDTDAAARLDVPVPRGVGRALGGGLRAYRLSVPLPANAWGLSAALEAVTPDGVALLGRTHGRPTGKSRRALSQAERHLRTSGRDADPVALHIPWGTVDSPPGSISLSVGPLGESPTAHAGDGPLHLASARGPPPA